MNGGSQTRESSLNKKRECDKPLMPQTEGVAIKRQRSKKEGENEPKTPARKPLLLWSCLFRGLLDPWLSEFALKASLSQILRKQGLAFEQMLLLTQKILIPL